MTDLIPSQGNPDIEARNELLHVMWAEGWSNESSGSPVAPGGRFSRMSNYPEDTESLQDAFGDELAARRLHVRQVLGHWLLTEGREGTRGVEEFSSHRQLGRAYLKLEVQYQAWVNGPMRSVES